MKALLQIAVSVFLALALSGAAFAGDLMSDIDDANQAFAKAVLDKDIDHLAGEYTSDACVLAPSAPRTCGPDAIRAFWTAVIESAPQNVQISTLAVGSSGELAYASGELEITAADGSSSAFNYVLVLKAVDGTWKLHLDTWTPQGG